MHEVKTFAKAGDAASAAVGSRARSVREGAKRARKQLPDKATVQQSSRRARKQAEKGFAAGRKQAERRYEAKLKQAEKRYEAKRKQAAKEFADRWGTAQDLLTERVHDARRDLAGRIDPRPARRRRWPLLLVLAVVSGAATAAALARRPQPVEAVGFGPGNPATRPRPVDGPLGAADGNGVVNAERPSATTD